MYVCLLCKKKLKKRNDSHFIKYHNCTFKNYYDKFLKKKGEGKCLNCGKVTPYHNGHYQKVCNTSCRGVLNGRSTAKKYPKHGKWLGKNYGSIGGKRGGKVGGKITHIKYPTMHSEIMHRNNKNKQFVKNKIAGIKRFNLENPEFKSKLGKRVRRMYPGLSSRTAKKNIANPNCNFGKGTVRPNREARSRTASQMIRDPNSNFGKKWGKKNKYKNVLMKSSWEVSFAKACDFYNLKWQYEIATFKLSHGKRYTPDFYLPEKDIWVEIKPKFRQTKELFTRGKRLDINLIILDLNDFESFFEDIFLN